MGLETNPQWLADLNRLWPLGTDQKRYGDDNIRNLKLALQNSFGGFAAGVWVTGTDGGAVNAYTVNPAVLPPSLGAKMTVVFSPVVTNTGACTLNYAGLGVKALKSVVGADLVANDLISGSIYAAFYTGTEYRLLSITKNYADQLAFSSALPAQAGNSRKLLTTNGTAASFSEKVYADTIRIVDGTDDTKKVQFDLTQIATATTRQVKFGDRDVDLGMSYAKFSDRKASGTAGGATLAADITQIRTLNTTETNTITGASLAANVVTLPAGTYRVKGRAPAFSLGLHQAFLYNSTDAAYTILGSGSLSFNEQTDSQISGQFTIAASKNFTVRHFTTAAVATGFGTAVNSGQQEVYAEIEFWKIA